MRRMLLALVFILALIAPAGAVAPPVVASANLNLVGALPEAGVISATFLTTKPVLVVSTAKGLSTWDISNPALPKLLGAIVLPHSQNEGVSVGERPDGKIFALIGVDEASYAPQTPTTPPHVFGGAGSKIMYIVELTDLANPVLRSRIDTKSSTHTVSCITTACEYVYTSGAYDDYFNVIDVRDLANPKEISTVYSPAHSGHDWDTDDSGLLWQVGRQGLVAYDASTNPANPTPVAVGNNASRNGASTYNNFILHNAQRPNATVFEQNEANGIRLPKDQANVNNGNVLLVTEEDYLDPTCGGGEGSFSTWYIPYTDADQLLIDNPKAFANSNTGTRASWGRGKVEPLDSWNTELLDTGRDTVAGALCSAHYFDFHQNGFIAQGWYQQGLRILDVRNPADIKQVGYYFTGAMETFAANWVPEYDATGKQTGRKTNMLYTQDPSRGLEFFTFTFPTTAPADTAPLRAPILPQWLDGTATVTTRESSGFGWLCRLPS
jgi:hypothetical protein